MTRPLGPFRLFAVVMTAVIGSLGHPGPAVHAQILADELPAEMEGVGIVQRLNEKVPLDLQFTDSEGRPVRLRDLLRPDRPALLALVYYRCPMLCSLTLNGLTDGLREMKWSVGDEFDIITVSINPNEDAPLAAQKKDGYLAAYGRESAGPGWHFLVGGQDEIELLAKSTGFGYRYDEKSGEYAHTASIVFLTPEGVISKYMNDVRFNPRDLRFALVEASNGGVGSPIDTLLLFNCFQWDPETGAYVADAWKIMRLGGILTVIFLGIGLIILNAKGPRHQDLPPSESSEEQAVPWESGNTVGSEA